VPQFELLTHATHLSALEQCGAVLGQLVSLVHSTHAPDEHVGLAMGQFVFDRHATHVPPAVSQKGVAIGQEVSLVQLTGAAASEPDEPGVPDEPDEPGAPEELDGAVPEDPEDVPEDEPLDAPPPLPEEAVPLEPPPPPSPPPVDDDVPPQAAKRPSDTPTDTPRNFRMSIILNSPPAPTPGASRTGFPASPAVWAIGGAKLH
jgi:hypothetical protein